MSMTDWSQPVIVTGIRKTIRSSGDALHFMDTNWRNLPPEERDSAYMDAFRAVSAIGSHEHARQSFCAMVRALDPD